MAKRIHIGFRAKHKLLCGVDVLARTVEGTLGPRSCCAILDMEDSPPLVINDGATIARQVRLEEPTENLGAFLVNEVAARTNDAVGDGTTTAVLLARSMLFHGSKLVAAGHDPNAIKRGMDLAVRAVVAELDAMAVPALGRKDMARVASISANNDKAIGQIIANALEKAGPDGVVTIEEGKGRDTTLETVEGMRFDRGYLSPYFITDLERMTCELEHPLILLSDKTIKGDHDLLPVLELALGIGRPLVVVAREISDKPLGLLAVNMVRGVVQTCAVKAPGFGESLSDMLGDLATLTGAQVISDELGVTVERAVIDHLGGADKFLVSKDSTTIIGGQGDRETVRARIDQLRGQMNLAEDQRERSGLATRIAKLFGGVCVLKLGASTETELKEKRARVDDALNATRAAQEEGIVPGGGVALVRCERVLEHLLPPGDDERFGVDVVRRSLSEPLRQLARNSGMEPGLVAGKVRDGNGGYGLNAYTREFEDLMLSGVIDPKKVTRVALQNAASIASLLLTTGAAVVFASGAEEDEEDLAGRNGQKMSAGLYGVS